MPSQLPWIAGGIRAMGTKGMSHFTALRSERMSRLVRGMASRAITIQASKAKDAAHGKNAAATSAGTKKSSPDGLLSRPDIQAPPEFTHIYIYIINLVSI